LAPALFPTYARVIEYVATCIGLPITLSASESLDELPLGTIDLAFLCGLQYVRLADAAVRRGAPPPVEVVAAPVLLDARYAGHPIYFSDLVVARDSSYRHVDDLAGCRCAYNERTSHSGYVVVQYSLLARGLGMTYFREWIATGAHARSLAVVARREADVAAIDSHVLQALFATDADLAAGVRIIGSLGPSTIPPLVVRHDVDDGLKRQVRDILAHLHEDASMRAHLQAGWIDRFVGMGDADYDDIRAMHAAVISDRT
jgi:phosphonate transport system substrate-binding protein